MHANGLCPCQTIATLILSASNCYSIKQNICGWSPVILPQTQNVQWLDVLCLRQQGGKGKDLRGEERKLHIPTISFVYSGAPVACYYSGLGRPLYLKPGYFDSDRCWFNRAWTLQEIVDGAITGEILVILLWSMKRYKQSSMND